MTDHDLSKRFGNMKRGIADITNHRFFKGLDFLALKQQRIVPPHIPSGVEGKSKDFMAVYTSETIPEARDGKSPELSREEDPFYDWFVR